MKQDGKKYCNKYFFNLTKRDIYYIVAYKKRGGFMILKERQVKTLEKLGINIRNYRSIRSVLTDIDESYMEHGYIGFREDPKITLDIQEEVVKTAKILEEYIRIYWAGQSFDYHLNSEGGCYFLSTLFALASDYTLVQGTIENGEKVMCHSWLKKDGIVYDPADRCVTTEEMYSIFYDEKECYTKEEIKDICKKTGAFGYYQQLLQEVPNRDFSEQKMNYLMAVNILEDLETFLKEKEEKPINTTGLEYFIRLAEEVGIPMAEAVAFMQEESFEPLKLAYQKKNWSNCLEWQIKTHFKMLQANKKRENLDGVTYEWGEYDVTNSVKEKAIAVAYEIVAKSGIPFEDAYKQYINTSHFHELEDVSNGKWMLPHQEFVASYFDREYQIPEESQERAKERYQELIQTLEYLKPDSEKLGTTSQYTKK